VFFSLFKKRDQGPAEPHEPARGNEVSCAWLAANRERVRMLDVRNRDEWERVHIADASLIPLSGLHEHAKGLGDRDATYVLVCRSGRRSLLAMRVMRKMGYPASFSLQGGVQAWEKAGLPVVRDTP